MNIFSIKYRYPFLYNRAQLKSVGATNRIGSPIESLVKTGLVIPAHGTYGGLLFDERWKAKRNFILNRDGYSCVICTSTENLQVHHRQYHYVLLENQFKPPWDYDHRLLITLCKNCHNRGHNKFKVPTLTI